MKGLVAALCLLIAGAAQAQVTGVDTPESDALRGSYGPYRANNDLLYYHLTLRVDPVAKFIRGKNLIRFKMLEAGNRIQLELVPVFEIEGIDLLDARGRATPLTYRRIAGRTLYVEFPHTLARGTVQEIEFRYSGHPHEMGRFGGFVFTQDPQGRPLVNTACEEEGASVWWPNKDQWRDEPEHMDLSVEAPSELQEVSGGRFQGKEDLHDGYTRWNWAVSYPINNYDVSLNIGRYEHFADRYGDLTLDYYVFPEDLSQARRQFVQVRDMLDAFTHYFGEYPFVRDGYKLVQALYSGVENQTAITYGNLFGNGYLGRPASGIGQRFDFIIVHESAHEWFGNSLTAKDRSDMWIQEGWANYLETLFVEYRWGKADAITYLNTGKENVKNELPVISAPQVYSTPPVDQYKKGALFLNTLRSVIDDDEEWFRLLHDYYQHFKYQTLLTEDVLAFFNQHTHRHLDVLFEQYLRHAAIPVLEWKFDAEKHTIDYRFHADVAGFHMPLRVAVSGSSEIIEPTDAWQTLVGVRSAAAFGVHTELYYINEKRLEP